MSDEIESIRRIPNALDRAKAVGVAHHRLLEEIEELSRIRREALDELLAGGMLRIEIAKKLGITRSRLSKLVASGPGPERALLAQNASVGSVVTVALVEKTMNDQRPGMVPSTHEASKKLDRLAVKMNLRTHEEGVPENGSVDLNRENLVVLIGPRITPLIAQAISADPTIKWRQDETDNWFMVDTSSNEEFHSDFDGDRAHKRKDGVCYAHIGRIRRPDGQGSFLYLGGIHAEGTAAAVEVLVRDIASLWEQVRRSNWSAVVKSTVVNGVVTEAELATPVHVHGKR